MLFFQMKTNDSNSFDKKTILVLEESGFVPSCFPGDYAKESYNDTNIYMKKYSLVTNLEKNLVVPCYICLSSNLKKNIIKVYFLHLYKNPIFMFYANNFSEYSLKTLIEKMHDLAYVLLQANTVNISLEIRKRERCKIAILKEDSIPPYCTTQIISIPG